MIQANQDARPSRPNTASLQVSPPLDVLSQVSQEVEDMRLAEEQEAEHAQALAAERARAERDDYAVGRREDQRYSAHPQPAHYAGGNAAPIDIGDGDDEPPPVSSARHQPPSPQDLPPPQSSSRQQRDSSPPSQALATIQRPLDPAPAAVIDTSDLRAFLLRPGPQGAMVQCYIQRRKSGLSRLYPTYEVYLKDGEQFLLAARRRKNKKQSNYKVSLDREDLSRHSSNFFGKLKSNFMGTEFQMYDNGVNPDKLTPEQRDGSGSQVRQELATILYKQKVLGPNVDEHGKRAELRPTTMEDTMIERYKAGKDQDNVQVLKNKQPKWNDQVGAYVLNFNG